MRARHVWAPRSRQIERSLAVLAPAVPDPAVQGYVRARLKTVCLDLFQAVAAVADVARLEAGARSEVDYDFAGLRDLIGRLAALPDESLDAETSGQATQARGDLERVRHLIEVTESQLDQIEPLEVGLRFELVIDSGLSRFLAILRRPSSEVERLVEAATVRLEQAPERDLQRLWARVTSEVEAPDPEDRWTPYLPLDPAVVAPGFFASVGVAGLARGIARYLVDYRPRLVRAAAKAGVGSVPMPPAPVSRVLAWKPGQPEQSFVERRLVEHLIFLSHLAAERLRVDEAEIAASLGVAESSRLLQGQSKEKARKLVPEEALATVVHSECSIVVGLLSDMVLGAPDHEFELLLRYKLALEVQLPASRRGVIGKAEESLQRQLMAFLIEHGTSVRGTKFGPSETDAVTGPDADPLIIEVKLFKDEPTRGQILRAFAQLRSYMDQAPYRSRGALVFFNLSDAPIVYDRELVDGRIAIVAVNLPRKTPSKRKRYIEVRVSRDPKEILDVLLVGGRARREQGDRKKRG